MSENAHLRASDADREATVARLQTALGEGRLDVDEFGDLVSEALAELVATVP